MAYITRYRHLPVISLRSSSFEISAIVDATRCAYCCQLSLCRLRTPVASVGTVHVSSHYHTLRQATPLITNNIKTPALIRILYTPNRVSFLRSTSFSWRPTRNSAIGIGEFNISAHHMLCIFMPDCTSSGRSWLPVASTVQSVHVTVRRRSWK